MSEEPKSELYMMGKGVMITMERYEVGQLKYLKAGKRGRTNKLTWTPVWVFRILVVIIGVLGIIATPGEKGRWLVILVICLGVLELIHRRRGGNK